MWCEILVFQEPGEVDIPRAVLGDIVIKELGVECLADGEIVAGSELAALHDFDTRAHVEIDADGGVGVQVLVVVAMDSVLAWKGFLNWSVSLKNSSVKCSPIWKVEVQEMHLRISAKEYLIQSKIQQQVYITLQMIRSEQ